MTQMKGTFEELQAGLWSTLVTIKPYSALEIRKLSLYVALAETTQVTLTTEDSKNAC